jgi:hypothetical protein
LVLGLALDLGAEGFAGLGVIRRNCTGRQGKGNRISSRLISGVGGVGRAARVLAR